MLERRESFSGRRTNKGGAWQQQTIAREIMGEKKRNRRKGRQYLVIDLRLRQDYYLSLRMTAGASGGRGQGPQPPFTTGAHKERWGAPGPKAVERPGAIRAEEHQSECTSSPSWLQPSGPVALSCRGSIPSWPSASCRHAEIRKVCNLGCPRACTKS